MNKLPENIKSLLIKRGISSKELSSWQAVRFLDFNAHLALLEILRTSSKEEIAEMNSLLKEKIRALHSGDEKEINGLLSHEKEMFKT